MQPNANQPEPGAPEHQPEPSTESQSWSQPSNEPAAVREYNISQPPTQPTQPIEPVQPLSTVQPIPSGQSSTSVAGSKGLAITALVLGIIGFLTGGIGIGIVLGFIAIILGIISLVKHQPGKGLAITAIVLGALAVVIGGILFLITMVAYNGIQERALNASLKSNASLIAKTAEARSISTDTYPTYEQLRTSESNYNLSEDAKSQLHQGAKESVTAEKPIAYESCGKGYAVHYWDSRQQSAQTVSFSNYAANCQ
jgi:Tfp pilus assembly protein PilE